MATTPGYDFGAMIERVAGQALAAAGYTLQDNPTHQSRGLYRYRKALPGGVSAYVEFQHLHYVVGGPSRFRVNLLRNDAADARAASQYSGRVDTTLTRLLWNDFDVQQLGSPDHWWVFRSPQELAYAIADAGKLLFGFGIPWLEGTLSPDSDEENG